MEYEARMGLEKCVITVLKHEGKRLHGNLDVDGATILKWIFKKQDVGCGLDQVAQNWLL